MKHVDMKEFFASKRFRVALGALGAVIAILASFAAGVAVGFHKAKYSYEWGSNYERNFVRGFGSGREDGRSSARTGMMSGGGMMDFRNAHGISGTVLSVSGNTVVVTDRDGKENTIAIDSRTVIKNGRDTVASTTLVTGEQVVIVGNPGSTGVVNADLVRIVGTGANAGNAVPNVNQNQGQISSPTSNQIPSVAN